MTIPFAKRQRVQIKSMNLPEQVWGFVEAFDRNHANGDIRETPLIGVRWITHDGKPSSEVCWVPDWMLEPLP